MITFQDDMMVRDSVKFLVDTMLKNDTDDEEASKRKEAIRLSTKTDDKRNSYCLC